MIGDSSNQAEKKGEAGGYVEQEPQKVDEELLAAPEPGQQPPLESQGQE